MSTTRHQPTSPATRHSPKPDAKQRAKQQRAEQRKRHAERRVIKPVYIAIKDLSVGGPDDVLSKQQLMVWLNVSRYFLELGRILGYGPRFVKLGPRKIGYRRGDVLKWLDEHSHNSTKEYDTSWDRKAAAG